MLHMCDLFFIFNLISIAIKKLIQTYALVFAYFLEYILLFLEHSLEDKSELIYLAFTGAFTNFSLEFLLKCCL